MGNAIITLYLGDLLRYRVAVWNAKGIPISIHYQWNEEKKRKKKIGPHWKQQTELSNAAVDEFFRGGVGNNEHVDIP
jgi:hypothetical protein